MYSTITLHYSIDSMVVPYCSMYCTVQYVVCFLCIWFPSYTRGTVLSLAASAASWVLASSPSSDSTAKPRPNFPFQLVLLVLVVLVSGRQFPILQLLNSYFKFHFPLERIAFAFKFYVVAAPELTRLFLTYALVDRIIKASNPLIQFQLGLAP
jgi:hypothetical protein